MSIFFSDFFISTELIPRKRLKKWINRTGFRTRKILILKWIVLGSILTMGYKCTLLSNLIPIQYEETIDTLQDLDQSGLSLLIPKDTDVHYSFANDQRPIMKRIFERSTLWTFTGPDSVANVYKKYKNKILINSIK